MVGTNLHIAAAYLQQGDLVAIPTETVYGLAANALNTDAVLKIFTTKQRPTFDPLIVHVASIQDLEKYVQHVPKEVYILAQHFSPGPITYILPKD